MECVKNVNTRLIQIIILAGRIPLRLEWNAFRKKYATNVLGDSLTGSSFTNPNKLAECVYLVPVIQLIVFQRIAYSCIAAYFAIYYNIIMSKRKGPGGSEENVNAEFVDFLMGILLHRFLI